MSEPVAGAPLWLLPPPVLLPQRNDTQARWLDRVETLVTGVPALAMPRVLRARLSRIIAMTNAHEATLLPPGTHHERLVGGVGEVRARVVAERLPLAKGRVVGDLNTKANREAEARRVGEVRRPSGNQADRLNRQGGAKVDLHPLASVGPGHDAAVIAVGRTRLGTHGTRQGSEILAQFLLEGLVTTFAGGAIGIAVSYGLVWLLSPRPFLSELLDDASRVNRLHDSGFESSLR